MTEWLSTLLPDSCPANAELAIARFATREAIGRNGFSLSSPAFPQGGELDPCFTADEEDAVAPPMEWTAPPKMAEELVLVVQDASAPDATCHWLVWGLPAQHGKLLEGDDYNHGFNAATGEYEDLVKSGVIDPAKVVRTALQDAASVASLLITTEALVAELPKEDAPAPMPAMDY